MARFSFPPRASRGAILGFTAGQLVMSTSGLLLLVGALNLAVAGDKLAATGVALAAGVVFIVGLARIKGRRLTEWLPIVIGALAQQARRQDRYRGAIFAPFGAEQLDLPGPLAGYEWLPAVRSDGLTPVGLLHHRAERTVTAVLACAGRNFLLADSSEQERRLVDWSAALNTLAVEYGERHLVRWALWTRAVPDVGNRAQRHLVDKAVDTTSAAYRSLAALTAAAAPGAQRQETYLVAVFDVARMSREIKNLGGGDEATAVLVTESLEGIESTVAEAGVGVGGWLPPRQLAAVIRSQFDPADAAAIDIRGGGGIAEGISPTAAGPAAAEADGWLAYRHDSAYSQTLWVYEMPRQDVSMTWLTPLFTASNVRRSISLTCQPVPAAMAAFQSRRERVARAGDETTKRKLRLLRTAREIAEGKSVDALDREQAAGHARLNYALLITVTSPTRARLDRDVLSIKRRLARARCEAVVLAGEQDQSFFAAGLPLARGLKPLRGPLL
ncbi:SCO6880 family protein [Longispora sp. NPDC051575]|uniref:SCO6880 family protein n=1 Tax=Longispora sp. NPDC051575 TaxID=3154943 RepID=UPI0034299E0B